MTQPEQRPPSGSVPRPKHPDLDPERTPDVDTENLPNRTDVPPATDANRDAGTTEPPD
ncbi:hypothetical protein [Amycolatopsis suaedae]|uniref:hypothetical protein n=1 Tax=Amycolatopsis suaedae TaxID=2510978 RepID=UPI0013EEF434|nr:hypothetical protein [Amycolatopsis suaedae]